MYMATLYLWFLPRSGSVVARLSSYRVVEQEEPPTTSEMARSYHSAQKHGRAYLIVIIGTFYYFNNDINGQELSSVPNCGPLACLSLVLCKTHVPIQTVR